MKNTFLASFAAGALFVATSGIAAAATQDFVVDWGNSSVTLTDQSGGGEFCVNTSCGLGVSLTGGPTSFSLAEGDGMDFDFLRWTGHGTTGLAARDFTVSATLAFASPLSSGSSNGAGSARFFLGHIFHGSLIWDSIPQITAANGSVYDMSFEGGSGWLIDGDAGYTSSATVSLVSTSSSSPSPSPVPLPAGGLLFLGGLGALVVARKRKNKAA